MKLFLISIIAAAVAVALLSAQDQGSSTSTSPAGSGNNSTSNETAASSVDDLTGIWTTDNGAFYFSVRQVKNLIWWYSVRIHNDNVNLTTTTARAGFDDDDEDAEEAVDELDDFRERFNSTYLSTMLNEHVFSGVYAKMPQRQAGNDSTVNSTAPYPVGKISGSWATIPITDLSAQLLRDEDDEEWGVLALNVLSDGSLQAIPQPGDRNSFVFSKLVRYNAAASLDQQDGSLGPYSGGCICTREYMPVCGRTATGLQTFSNMCVMNCNRAIFVYRGQCNSGTNSSPAIPEDQGEPCICTLEYMPVCGRTPAGAMQTFGNRCQLGCARATFEHEGECRSA